MELIEFYNQIKNPIDDNNVINKIITAYSKCDSLGGFYGKITRTTEKEYSGKYIIPYSDEFYSMVFNKWKNSIF